MREVEDNLRRELTQWMQDRATSAGIEVRADGLAFASGPELSVVNAPAAGLEKLDVTTLLERGYRLDDAPVMAWYLAGDALADEAVPLAEGLYVVVADHRRWAVALRDERGETVAHGALDVCITPPPPPEAMAKVSVSGNIDKFDVDLKKKHIEVCGHASVSVGGAEVKIEGCISVDW